MRKLIQALQFESFLLTSLSQNYNSNHCKSLAPLISSSSTFSHNRAFSSTPDLNAKNSVLADYLIGSLKFSKDRALSVSRHYSHIKSLEKPEEVVHYFKGLGLSDAHIQSISRRVPQVMFADVENTLKPKVIFFQELGLSGPCLCSLVSRNPGILRCNLDKTLKPWIYLIKKVLDSDGRYRSKEQINDDLLRMLTRCCTIAPLHLEANVLYLKSCGVVGSQLSSLLVLQTRLFALPKEKLEQVISRAVGMNFSMGSRMLAHAIHTLSCLSIETLNGRFEVLMMFGFSKDEVASMFRKTPCLFRLSEANLRSKLEFFLNNLKIDKLLLVRNPTLLGLSIEERVIPRCKVVEILRSRRLLRRDSGFISTMTMSNQRFVEKYILPFKNDAEELLLAYKGKLLDTSEK